MKKAVDAGRVCVCVCVCAKENIGALTTYQSIKRTHRPLDQERVSIGYEPLNWCPRHEPMSRPKQDPWRRRREERRGWGRWKGCQEGQESFTSKDEG